MWKLVRRPLSKLGLEVVGAWTGGVRGGKGLVVHLES